MYPDDQVSEERPEDTIAELIRGAFLEELDDELPHSLAVVVDSIEHRRQRERQSYEGKIQVMVSVYVERDSQKPIIIGRGAEHLVRVRRSCAPRSTASSEARPSSICMSRSPRAGSPTPSSWRGSASDCAPRGRWHR